MAKIATKGMKRITAKKSIVEGDRGQTGAINDYHYVINDLKKIGLISGLLILLLVALSFII